MQLWVITGNQRSLKAVIGHYVIIDNYLEKSQRIPSAF